MPGAIRQRKPKSLRFVIDASIPIKDAILDGPHLAAYLQTRLKVGGKAGAASVSSESSNVVVLVPAPFSKRYVKYLAKKYLKKQQLRDYLRIVASGPTTYSVRYYNIEDADAEEN